MNEDKSLLQAVSDGYGIIKGNTESYDEWLARLIYSICGMMAYASLWDKDEKEPVSIIHMKNRIRRTFSDYRTIYHESSVLLPQNSDELEEEITEQFQACGIVYHRPNHIAPSMKRAAELDGIAFQRGIAIDSISRVSGLGFYSNQAEAGSADNVREMFGLEMHDLKGLWRSMIAAASWGNAPEFDSRVEYLRTEPPFSRTYWENRPEMTGEISILRVGERGSQLYYLYRRNENAMEISPLPHRMVDGSAYRRLACALLCDRGTLPKIEYRNDGALVHITLNYLLPPRELNFLKLYSWPETCASLPSNFRRKLSADVFRAVKDVLSCEGYEFKEGAV